MGKPLLIRLSLMMFLEFFIWGCWFTSIAVYMTEEGMGTLTHWPYTVNPIAAILAPFILGLIGSIVGFFLGTMFASLFGREIFKFTAMDIKPMWNIFVIGILIFPALWMLAGWIPALLTTQIDAAQTLSRE